MKTPDDKPLFTLTVHEVKLVELAILEASSMMSQRENYGFRPLGYYDEEKSELNNLLTRIKECQDENNN